MKGADTSLTIDSRKRSRDDPIKLEDVLITSAGLFLPESVRRRQESQAGIETRDIPGAQTIFRNSDLQQEHSESHHTRPPHNQNGCQGAI